MGVQHEPEKGFEAYGSREGVNMNPRTTKWFRNHAQYDDDHPRIALEIVARYARTERAQLKVMTAARRSLQLLNLALLRSSRAYSTRAAPGISIGRERRAADRRLTREHIAFPDRRIIDRRGTAVSTKARHEIRMPAPEVTRLPA
jgi:hypothetical protein